MARQRIIGTIKGLSFLLALTLALLYLLVNVEGLFTQDADLWRTRLLTMLLALSLILVTGFILAPKVVKALARANYWKALLMSFVPSALVTSVALWILGFTFGKVSINPLTALSYVPAYLLIFQLLVVSQIEEIIFRGILFESLYKNSTLMASSLITAVVFAIYHFTASGGSWSVMATYVPLSLVWTYIKLNGYPGLRSLPKIGRFFGATRLTQQANAGSHFAWNLFIVGFIRPLSG